MSAPIITHKLSVVFFSQLRQSHTYLEQEGFRGFTYGDAVHTIVSVESVIYEVEAMNDQSQYDDLLSDLSSLPANTLIAFDG